MGSITIKVTASNVLGSSASVSIPVVSDDLTLSATVTPTSGPAGTKYTLTATASSSSGSAITFATPTAVGAQVVFTPVPNKPAGQAQWTFTF